MADLAPLRGWRYCPEKVKDLGQVAAPPYDVIDPARQRHLHERHPWNVIRLILGDILPGDDDRENRYTRAARSLRDWQREGILKRDERPAIYIYQQRFDGPDARRMIRKGFVALLRLEPIGDGKVFPHEETFPKHRIDRLCLMRACAAHFNPILSLYPDPKRELDEFLRPPPGPPAARVIDDDGVEHELWAQTDLQAVGAIVQAMKGRPVFLADGHHRYETCLNYRDERQEMDGPLGPLHPAQWTLMYFTPMEDEGLVIYPTHKLVSDIQGFSPAVLVKRLHKEFDVQTFAFSGTNEMQVRGLFLRTLRETGTRRSAIGMAIRGETAYRILAPKNPARLAGRLAALPECLRGLAVTHLHEVIFRTLLGIEVTDPRDRHLLCLHDADQSLNRVIDGEVQVGFIMNPTRIEDLKTVAGARCKMPQKATYFYPKLLSGLVTNAMEGQQAVFVP